MRLSQRPPSGTAEACAGSAHWRYRAVPWRPSPTCCRSQRTSSVAQVSQHPDVRSGASPTIIYAADFHGQDVDETSDYGRPANIASAEAQVMVHEPESSLIVHQHDFVGQCYSSATVSAMARLIGQTDDSEHLLAAGQASVVVLPKADLLNVLKAGSDTPLDQASAALALLCEAGQYDAVVQYGNPLLKAASAAMPFSPLGVGKHPVPHLERLACDLALSIALAHISLAGGAGGGGAGLLAAGVGAGVASGETSGLEGVLGHLEAALQVLERHQVAAPLQQEVAYCLQGVAAAFAEEVLCSTHPVVSGSTPPPPPPLPSVGAVGANSGSPGQLAAAAGIGGQHSATAAASGAAAAAAGAARRAKAISVLRGVLWRGAPPPQNNPPHNHQNQPPLQQQQQQRGSVAVAASAEAGSSSSAPLAAAAGGSGGGGGWVPELTSDERTELMAPLRGLLAASEHIALYGPVASGQKPYGAVELSDQELYDLAIAHLAQGVTTGWPQHVLQALSYFERVAQQQQQQGALAGEGSHVGAAAAADVSFERRVCEALLGRRSTAAGPADPPPPAAAAAAAAESAAGGAESSGSTASAASLSYSVSGEEWYDDGDESTLLRRLEAQLLLAAGRGGGGGGGGASFAAGGWGALAGAADGAVVFSVNERGDGVGSEYDDDEYDYAMGAVRGSSAAVGETGAALLPGASAALGGSKTPSAAVTTAAAVLTAAQQQQQSGGRVRAKSSSSSSSDRDDEVARKYGWAESWLELSVMPCFPETAGGGSVSLARWFADPRVILFNKLLAVRSGEAQVTAALGSAVAHVSYASRQRLWQLWQAAANAVSSARGHSQPQQPQPVAGAAKATTAAAAAAGSAGAAAEVAAAAQETGVGATGLGSKGAVAPLASGLLAQSRAALQDVAPRAAAAASAVAAAAAAVGSAAASSPRAVAAAAGWMVPFGLARWGSAGKPAAAAAAPGGGGGGRSAVAAAALPRTVADAATEIVTSTGDGEAAAAAAAAASLHPRQRRFSADVDAAGRSDDPRQGQLPPQQPMAPRAPNTNNVVPFPAGVAAAGGGGGATGTAVLSSPPPAITAAPPVAGELCDVALAAPPAGAGGGAAAASAEAAAAGALWAPDAEGHLRPRPRMVAGVVQRAAAAAASIKERVAALPGTPGRDWTLDPASADEATSREAVRRVAAVAAQAVCLGALAAYVGNRIVASGALQAAAASGYGAAAAAAAPTVDASTAQLAVAARAVARWLGGGGGVGSAAQDEGMGQWPLLGSAGRPVELLVTGAEAESVGRLAEQYGRRAQLDETAAVALLRGWAAARAAAPALTDPRDRVELLSRLLGGRALKVARAEADRSARMGRRVQLQRIGVELEQLRSQPAAAAGQQGMSLAAEEVAVTAAVLTAGTETSRASPLPLSYCTRERLTLTFRRGGGAPPLAEGPSAAAAVAAAAHGGPVWRLVDIRDAPPALY